MCECPSRVETQILRFYARNVHIQRRHVVEACSWPLKAIAAMKPAQKVFIAPSCRHYYILPKFHTLHKNYNHEAHTHNYCNAICCRSADTRGLRAEDAGHGWQGNNGENRQHGHCKGPWR